MRKAIWIFLISFSLPLQAAEGPSTGKISWQPWSDAIFIRAGQEQRLVILDLEAVWCHWCHVMERETYSHPEVAALIRERYIPVRVDQDSRPDLANRYRDYGWPATIVFDGAGRELAKRAGYIPPDEMLALLKRLAQNPTKALPDVEPQAFSAKGALSEELRETLRQRHLAAQDAELGGLRLVHKFLDADSVEYSLRAAQAGDEAEAGRARRTLDAALTLLDPVWGGVYQYSHGGVWENPHYEKIMSVQRDHLRLFSLAYSQWGDPRYLHAAQAVRRYLSEFLLGPEGGLYTSQDADAVPGEHSAEYFALDDGARRKLGVPRIDRHRYARENGWAVEGLVALYRAGGDAEALRLARDAAHWVLQNRSLARSPFEAARWLAQRGFSPVGGFRHDALDSAGPYFGDSLAMGRACLALYGATGEREWLQRAELTARFLAANFQDPKGAGFVTAAGRGALAPVRNVDENISAARFWNLLSHYSGQAEYRGYAERALRFLATPAVATGRLTEAGILLADEELGSTPTHITVVGEKQDLRAMELFLAAMKVGSEYFRLEWWDRAEGPLQNPDVAYPITEQSAAFVCSGRLCSSPIYVPGDILARMRRMARVPSN